VTIERFRGLLAAIGLPVSARELTEILWLACQLTAEPATAGGAPTDGHPNDQQPGQPGMQEGPAGGASQSLTDEGAGRASEAGDGTAAQGLYTEAGTGGRTFDAGIVQVPTAPMLNNILAIQRALRPLKLKVASHRTDVLDEKATARRIAEQPLRHRRWVPVMQPSPERWLNLALVVDTGPSMWIWRPLARELEEALTRVGAFRDLRIWYLNGGTVSTTLGGPPLNAAALLDPSGRQACLVFSDCSGAHWWNGSALRALHLWGQNGPVGILQPLAERLWRRTAAPPVPGLAGVRRAAAPNIELLFTPYDTNPGHGIPVPVMEISPLWLADWARLITGRSSSSLPMAVTYVPGRPVTRAEPLQRERDLPVTERVQRFQATASPEAARLAAHVAVSVPTLPVMRLIHHQLLGNPQPGHIAEVLLSGLLRSVEGAPGAYEFIPGARQALLATLPRSESWYAADVLSRISSEIENRVDRGGEIFRAYLRVPGGTGERASVSNRPFALISPEALRYLRRDAIAPISPARQRMPPSAGEAHNRVQAVDTQSRAGQLLEEAPSGRGVTAHEHGEIFQAPGGPPLFRILGPLEVWTGQDWTAIRIPRWRAVLASLLIRRGQRVSAEELATEIWGANQPVQVNNLISVYIHRLRQLMGDTQRAVLVTRPGGYELVLRQGDLDADRFTRLVGIAKEALVQGQTTRSADLLTEALGLWRGNALADVPSTPLVTAEADRLEEARVEAAALQAEASLACGRHTHAVMELRRLVWDHPLREDLCAQLMRALMAMGRQAEALDAYRQAATVIADELGIDPGPALRQLYAQILQSDTISGKAREPVYRLKPVPAPTQLPSTIAEFTGRAEETEALWRLLAHEGGSDTPAVPVVAVVGLAGVGKTALAVHTAHLLADRFPDGQLYASLGGTSQPVVPADVLAWFLRELGVDPAHIPADTEARVAVYRAALAGCRVMVVLDDAADAAQVQPLLPGSASCAVLITSRHRLHDLENGEVLNLGVLPPGDAIELFTRVAGEERVHAEPDAAQEVLTACGNLPLAIRIAGAQLASHPSWSVRALAERLADQRNRLDELQIGNLTVRAAFELSYANLLRVRKKRGIDAVRMFHLLGLWTGPSISLRAASALVGEPQSVAMTALETLVDEHMLESLAPDRYRFHDLIRAYAAERSQAGEKERSREAAIARLLNWYLHSAESAAQVISAHHTRVPLSPPPREVRPLELSSLENALAWCEAERTCLISAVGLANSSALHDIAWKLPAAAMSFFYRRSHWNEWISTHQIGLASARALADKRAEAWMLNNLGVAYRIRHSEEGIEYLRQAMAIYTEIGDSQGEARAANNVATAYLDLQLFGAAFEAAQHSMEIQRTVKSRYGEGIAVGILGNCFQHSGRYDQGLDFLQKSLAIFRELEDRDAEADALADLGDIYLSLGQVSKARECLHESLVITRAIGNRYGEAATLQRLGRAEAQGGSVSEAHELLSEAMSLFEELGDVTQVNETQAAVARIAPTEANRARIGVLTNERPSEAIQRVESVTVRRPSLGKLISLARGAFGEVYRADNFALPGETAPLVYKQFTANRAEQAYSAESAVEFRGALSLAERAELDSFSAWPRALVEDEAGEVCGLLMSLLPKEFLLGSAADDSGESASTPREMSWLIASLEQRRAAQVHLPEIGRGDRLTLLAQLAHAIEWLHKRGWVFGDLSFKSIAFAVAPPRIMLLDCDGAAAVADDNRMQSSTPSWDPPECSLYPSSGNPRQTLQDPVTDVYKLGLAMLRGLTPGKGAASTTDAHRLDGVLDAEGIDLVAKALSVDRASRPSASELARYLDQLLSVGTPTSRRERAEEAQGQMVMPFYVICDVSYSMSSDIAALNDSIERLRRAIVAQPVVDDVAQICVISFSDRAKVVMPMGQMSETVIPALSVEGGTNYGAAFRRLAQTIILDTASLKDQGYKVHRPCAFFLSDGRPNDHDWLRTFTETLTYDRTSGRGMREHPIFVPFGFRDASAEVLKQLAYPPEYGKWYKARSAPVEHALTSIIDVIMKTVVTSGMSVRTGQPTVILQPPPAGSGIESGDSEFDSDWV
jgi:DNA-binding SARP family transcriptional activator/uncharacterized protein YegL